MAGKTELQAIAGTSSGDRTADIIFVHGLDGDKRLSWQQEDYEDSFWPKLLFNDIPTCGVWSFGYDARSSEWIHGGTMPIVDRATNFAAFLRSEGIGDKPIYFIVHSLGGLVVKQVLRSRFDRDQDDPLIKQTKGIFFFATPHGGSDLSNLVQWLRFYRPTVLIKELESAAAPLRDLNAWYRANSQRLGIQTTVFAETQKTKGVMIVDQLSSDPGIAEAEIIPVDANHIEICKVDIKSMPYKTVRSSIENFIRSTTPELELAHESPLWMNVSCFNKYPDQWEEKDIPKMSDHILKYRGTSNSNVVEITPELPYLDSVRNGEPVWSIPFMWQPFRWLPLNLDLKFLNQGSDTIYITQLIVEVRRSAANTEPILLIQRGRSFPYFGLTNDGWGNIREPKLFLAFEDGREKPSFPGAFPVEVTVDEFTDFVDFDLTDQFKQLGVDVDAVMKHHNSPDLGPFQSGIAYVYGLLKFRDDEGMAREFRFGTNMDIKGPLYGMYGPPTYEYQTRLLVDGENYNRTVDVSHVIKPGESDRFLFQLDVDKSSNHELNITAIGSQGKITTSHPIHVSIVVPRSVHERVSDIESSNPFMFK